MESTKAAAQLLSDCFKTGTRENGEVFYKLTDDAPEWVRDAVRDAHDNANILPNDWIYQCCASIAEGMAYEDDDSSWDDLAHEWADSCVDVYNGERAAWLASHLAFGGYVDEAREQYGRGDDIYDDIGQGQYLLASEIAGSLIQAARDAAEDMDEDED